MPRVYHKDYLLSNGETMTLMTRDINQDFEIGSEHLQMDAGIETVVKKLAIR